MRRWWARRPIVGWALYDWANSAFSLTVVTAFVPVMLAGYWSDGAESTVTTFRLGLANGTASAIVAILSPLLGALADRFGRRKGMLFILAMLGIVSTGSLYFVAEGQWQLAVACFGCALIGFAGSVSLYDSLLVDVAPDSHYDEVSAYGFALGYLGGAVLFALNVFMVASPAAFGLASPTEAIRVSFATVAIWWFLFSMPLLFWVKEHPHPGQGRLIAETLAELVHTVRAIVHDRNLLFFLLAYWLYIDGVDTIIKMAVDYGLSLGFTPQDLVSALLLVQFVGFPSALVFGWLGGRIGPKTGIIAGLVVYVGITVWAYFISETWEFYGVAVAIGLVQGGVQALSRSLYARIIPQESAAEFFGFYNFLGKFAAVLGPVMMGWVAIATGSTRVSILSILVLFIAGGLILTRVDVKKNNNRSL